MIRYFPLLRVVPALLLTLGLGLAGCEKNDTGTLDGPVPAPGFTYSLDASQFPVVATFTTSNPDAFLAQWDFGDGSPLVTGANVTHVYRRPGSFEARLIVAGRGGTGTSPMQVVSVPTACDIEAFSNLTGCATGGNRAWTISNQLGGITRLDAGGNVIFQSSPGALSPCQSDDEFTFGSTFNYNYNSNGGTFKDDSCSTALDAVSDFVFRPNPGGLPQLVLQAKKTFIGLPDSVVNKTYELVQADPTVLRIQGTNPDGSRTIITYRPQLSGLDRARDMLTAGSSKTWKLDNTVANAIIVGTEANPAEYYPGAPLGGLPACQADDEYTFTLAGEFTYNPLAETSVGVDQTTGTIPGPGVYACKPPRPSTSAFTLASPLGTGLAQLKLANPLSFVGVTDLQLPTASYRILSISPTNMTIRGVRTDDGAVFTMKMRVR
ncbi:MAG: PKD domain-containing protein [Hymenobacteraceae bacterium]|nr:PKD domain-containing protein [Hymenobacteraceae bacterium]